MYTHIITHGHNLPCTCTYSLIHVHTDTNMNWYVHHTHHCAYVPVFPAVPSTTVPPGLICPAQMCM